MKKIAAGSVLFCFVFVLLFSCKHEIPTLPINTGGDSVCFENDVLPIFIKNCANASGCHNAGDRQEGYQLDNYTNIISRGITPEHASDSKIYKVLIEDNPSKIMPPLSSSLGPLTDEQKNVIAKWIDQGARNTTCAASCDSSNFTYTGGVAPILQTYCLGCHGNGASDGDYVVLDNYDDVKSYKDKIYASITYTGTYKMPKSADKLSDCNIAVIRKWIEAGAPK